MKSPTISWVFLLLATIGALRCQDPNLRPVRAAIAPAASDLESWWAAVSADPAPGPLKDGFVAAARRTIDDLQSGRPIEIEEPSISPIAGRVRELQDWVSHRDGNTITFDHRMDLPYEARSEEFGVPIHQIGDSFPVEVFFALTAKHDVLRWYAARGIYPMNSTKVMRP